MIVDVAKQSSLAKPFFAVGENFLAILRLNLSKFGYVGFPRQCVVVLSASNLECAVSAFFTSFHLWKSFLYEMGDITGGVTVSADGKCRDFAFGVLTSSGQRALLVFAYICLLFSTLSLRCVYLFFLYNVGPAVVTLRQQTPFKLISRFHPIIQNAMNVV